METPQKMCGNASKKGNTSTKKSFKKKNASKIFRKRLNNIGTSIKNIGISLKNICQLKSGHPSKI